MKGLIMAGGAGTRLDPLTRAVNKHLLPVHGKPMIYHPVRQLVEAGIKEILIVTGVDHIGQIAKTLSDGSEFGCSLTFAVQRQPLGIAHGLSLAKSFVGTDSLTVLLGDNIFEESLAPYVENFLRQKSGCRLILKKVEDPSRYGVAEMDKDRLVGIQEKPKKPKSNLAVVGAYIYDSRVWEFIPQLKPSARGELEITDLNNEYIRRGLAQYNILNGNWIDAGTIESLAEANQIFSKLKAA